jgi:hypothetical protein
MLSPVETADIERIEIGGVLMRAAALQASQGTTMRRIPDSLVRDLLIAVLLTEERPSARSRLERAVGPDFAERLLTGRLNATRRAE